MLCSHYTSQEGLLSIIEYEKLWATNIKYLNDNKEYNDAIDHLSKLIPTGNLDNNFENSVVDTYKKLLIESLDSIKNSWKNRNYTISFSKEKDLLSQWRGYCPENNGYGLLFDFNELVNKISENFGFIYYGDCIYDLGEKIDKLKEILNDGYRNTFESIIAFENDLGEVEQNIDELACLFKNESFSEEKEKRIVISLDGFEGDGISKFRPGKNSIIPYLEIEFPRDCIKEIIIGPTIDPERSEYALDQFLFRQYAVDRPKISHSKIPFRSW